MDKFIIGQRWLLTLSVAVTLFGLFMALFSGTSLFAFFNHQIDPAFWGTNAVGATAKLFQQWIYGVWGATIAGWGVILIYIVRYPFARKERWAWRGVVLGLLVWYLLDTLLSVLYRVYFNAAFNTLILIMAAPPLIFTSKDFD